VAQEAGARDIFAAVAEEVGRLACADVVHMIRYHSDGSTSAIGGWSDGVRVLESSDRYPVGGNNVATLVHETGLPARIDHAREISGMPASLLREAGVRSFVGVPVVVEGKLWGAIVAGSKSRDPMPHTAEERMLAFGELLGAAITSSRTRGQLNALLRQEEALRRVAMLVARDAPQDELFDAVASEVMCLFDANIAYLCRHETADRVCVLASSSNAAEPPAPGTRLPLRGDGALATVYRTCRPARVYDYEGLSGPLVDQARALGVVASAAAPVMVASGVWGVVSVATVDSDRLPRDTEDLLESFAELVTAAIANSEARAELAASRARVVATSDETRRRIERNLHDATQQRLVTLALELRAAREGPPDRLDSALEQVEHGIREVLEEVREIARGLHPAILSEGGLGPALKSLARRSGLPVDLDLEVDGRLPEPVEVAAYYVVSEALTNAAKHAGASGASVGLERRNGTLRVSIRDDGVGGADPSRGSGLVGLSDRVAALGGHVEVASPRGSGTSILVEIPVDDHASTS
jgi:signal transduction histidine kinase